MISLLILSLMLAGSGTSPAVDLDEIVQKAAATLNSDWARDPDYAYIERDETRKDDSRTSRTSQVVTMEGSDYYLPIAIDDRPLSPDAEKWELRKLKSEYLRRKAEDPASRRRRIGDYTKQRDENGALLLDFPKAFVFQVVGEETMGGYPAYVLSATPAKRSGPLSRAAKVLAGMRGTVWIEKENFHTIRGECTVISPVPIYGLLARVLPGSRVELDMTRVNESTWLIGRLSISLALSKFFWFRSTQAAITTYSDYRLNSQILDELLAKAGEP